MERKSAMFDLRNLPLFPILNQSLLFYSACINIHICLKLHVCAHAKANPSTTKDSRFYQAINY